MRSPRRGLASLTVTVLVLTILGAVAPPSASAAPPANDNLSGASPVAVATTIPLDVAEATVQTGEPVGSDQSCNSIARSVWYRYTTTSSPSTSLTLETLAPIPSGTRDTVVRVWSGPPSATDPASLAFVACNDDINVANNRLSRVTFTPTASTTYYVQVGTFTTTSAADFRLRFVDASAVGAVPPNDAFATPQVLPGTTGTATGDTRPATEEPAETGDFTVWYSWTAPRSGSLHLETSETSTPGVDTDLRVFVGSAPTLANRVAANDDISGSTPVNRLSRVDLAVLGGTTYAVSVGGFSQPQFPRGAFGLSYAFTPDPPVATTSTLTATTTDQRVTLAATVAPASGSNVPTGSVEFLEGATSLGTSAVEGGTATLLLDTAEALPGSHDYIAVYTPADASFFTGSTSAPASATVPPTPTTTTITAASASGRTVTVEITATPDNTTFPGFGGTVRLLDGATQVGEQPATAPITFTLTGVSAGTHTYTAELVSSSISYTGSTSAPRTVSVAPVTSTTALTSAVSGQRVTLSATVASPDPGTPATGTVQFFEGTTSRGSAPVSPSGTASLVLTGVRPGAHTYRAVFSSSSANLSGSTSPDRSASVAKLVSKVTLAAPARARAGSRPKVGVLVKVGSAAATGKVRLTLNGKAVKTVALRGGKASITLPRLKAGKAKVVVTYLGDATTKPASASRTITVTRPR